MINRLLIVCGTKLFILDTTADLFFLNSGLGPIFLASSFQATTTILALLVLGLLMLSFFISGAEIAFFSLNYRDINTLKTKQDAGWKRIVTLLEEPKNLLAALLIANSCVNIAIIILSNLLIDQLIPLNGKMDMEYAKLPIKVVVITTIILLFGEILPKIRAANNNLRTAYESSPLVEVIYYLFKRVANWIIGISDKLEKAFGGSVSRALTQQQMEEAIRSTVHEEKEQKILEGIYKFSNITVKQIMRTRLDVSGINHHSNFP